MWEGYQNPAHRPSVRSRRRTQSRTKMRGEASPLRVPAHPDRSRGNSARELSEPLGLPRREAAEVEVERVESWGVTVARELDLKLHLLSGDRQLADGSLGAAPRPVRHPVRTTARELAAKYGVACLPTQDLLIWHVDPRARRCPDDPMGWAKPVARGVDARRVCRRPPWKARAS